MNGVYRLGMWAVVALLTVSMAFPALAGDLEKAKAAYETQDFATALPMFEKLAANGDAAAQFGLGLMYGNGEGVPQNQETALKWYRLAAQQGHVYAQINLGIMYANGMGVGPDMAEAVKWTRLAADQGDANAQFNLGWMYSEGKGISRDVKEAASLYRLAADQGNKEAQYFLGILYSKGEGVVRDWKEAEKLYRLSAEQGYEAAKAVVKYLSPQNGKALSALAQANISHAHRDYDVAFKQFKALAKDGNPEAQHWLGVYYDFGMGVAEDFVESWKWQERAAEGGYPEAMVFVARQYRLGTPTLAQDMPKALALYKRAMKIDHPLPEASVAVAVMYLKGNGVEKKPSEARTWMAYGAKHGSADAQTLLGSAYITGLGGPVDKTLGIQWLEKAVKQGHVEARELLLRAHAESIHEELKNDERQDK